MVGYGGKDLQKRKVLSLEWKSEGVMDDESGESMEPMSKIGGGCSSSWQAHSRLLFAVGYMTDVRGLQYSMLR